MAVFKGKNFHAHSVTVHTKMRKWLIFLVFPTVHTRGVNPGGLGGRDPRF